MHRGFLPAAMLAAAFGIAASADVLTFDGAICSNSVDGTGASVPCLTGSFVNQAYGDGPLINVTYQAGSTNVSLQHWPFSGPFQGYSDLTNVAYGYFGAGTASVILAPLGGSMVTLNSFSLGSTASITRTVTVDVIDLGSNVSVFSTSATMGAASILISPGVSSLFGFRITYTGDVFNVGIDNVNFNAAPVTTGAVPEPSTMGLLTVGALAVLTNQYRRRKRVSIP